ncbi:hypothetical protein H4S08_004580 [Coemansia sp. RSA 1365]|nr:hypothetical protein H4S08_004580 [Coemansia sp. RSA 1365]
MLSEPDGSWLISAGIAATLPRNFQLSPQLRRRIEGLGPRIREAKCALAATAAATRSRARMSMPADICETLDLASCTGDGSILPEASLYDIGSQSNMLHALLSSLPEPPITQPDGPSVLGTLDALADELPQPPLSPSLQSIHVSPTSPPLSPPTSPKPTPSETVDPARSFHLLPPPNAVTTTPTPEAAANNTIPSDNKTVAPQQQQQQQQQPTETRVAISLSAIQSPVLPQSGHSEDSIFEAAHSILGSFDAMPVLETPLPSRRNTDEVSLSQQNRQELQHLSPEAPPATVSECQNRAISPSLSLLDGEMPPESPFFEGVSVEDILNARESLREAKRATWCASNATPLFTSLHRTNKTPARASLAGLLDGWRQLSPTEPTQSTGSKAGENVQRHIPPCLPQPTADPRVIPVCRKYNAPEKDHADGLAEGVDITHTAPTPAAHTQTGPCQTRLFRVSVNSASLSPLSSAERRRVQVEGMDAFGLPVKVSDCEAKDALRHFPSVLAMRERQPCSSLGRNRIRPTQPTRMRTPSARHAYKCGGDYKKAPSVSFFVGGGGPDEKQQVSDRFIQSVDIEAMLEAYLPHVHSMLHAEQDSADTELTRMRAPSESSALTLADTTSSSPEYADSCQSASSEDTLLQSTRSQPVVRPPLSFLRKPTRRSDAGLIGDSNNAKMSLDMAAKNSGKTTKTLRPVATVANLRQTERERATMLGQPASEPRRRVHTVSQIAAPSSLRTPSRRRSEVQSLLTQANAVLSNGRHPQQPHLQRRRTAELSGTSQTIGRIRPPRASLPLAANLGTVRRANSIVISPRASLLSSPNSRASIFSDSGNPHTRIAPPSLSLAQQRAPISLNTALNRQPHRLTGSGRDDFDEISPLSLTPVGGSMLEIAACHLPATQRARTSISLGGLRTPNSTPANASKIPQVNAGPTITSVGRTRSSNVSISEPLRLSSSMVAGTSNGGLSGIPRPQPRQLRRLESSAVLRGSNSNYNSSNSTIGYSACYSNDSDSDGSSAVFPSYSSAPRRRPTGRRPGLNRLAQEEEFLTLRPVHTPDIIPCMIDPHLVERAMTPMLKNNIGPQNNSCSSSLAQIIKKHQTLESSNTIDNQHNAPQNKTLDGVVADAASRLSTVLEVPPLAEQPASRISPLGTPNGSPMVRSSNDSGRKFGRPGFLTRRWTKHSTSPVPVSAIPMPPTPGKSLHVLKETSSETSRIPSLRKARSLWSIRGLNK